MIPFRYLPTAAPLLEEIFSLAKDGNPVYVAIDGHAASGKSSFGAWLAKECQGNLFHMDDFFLRMEQRTPERMKEVGGNVDYERFQKEVVTGILSGAPFSYQKWDCPTKALGQWVSVSPRQISIVEGAYSLHPYLSLPYQVKVFLTIEPSVQEERILRRNGPDMLRVFQREWIPKEHAYFDEMKISSQCSFIF